jgi:hypothetical protein
MKKLSNLLSRSISDSFCLPMDQRWGNVTHPFHGPKDPVDLRPDDFDTVLFIDESNHLQRKTAPIGWRAFHNDLEKVLGEFIGLPSNWDRDTVFSFLCCFTALETCQFFVHQYREWLSAIRKNFYSRYYQTKMTRGRGQRRQSEADMWGHREEERRGRKIDPELQAKLENDEILYREEITGAISIEKCLARVAARYHEKLWKFGDIYSHLLELGDLLRRDDLDKAADLLHSSAVKTKKLGFSEYIVHPTIPAAPQPPEPPRKKVTFGKFRQVNIIHGPPLVAGPLNAAPITAAPQSP